MHYRRLTCALAGLALIAASSLASSQVPSGASGTLSVQTTPPEATVIVDGEVRGTSPIILPNLAPGAHRVVIKRAGFLENSADVEVTAGRTTTLDRALSPEPRTGTGRQSPPKQTAPAPPQRSSPPPQTSSPPPRSSPVTSSGPGSGRKWALIGLAGGAGAAAAGLAATQKNKAPVAGTISISPTGTGMAGQTNFSVRSVGASDPNKDSLTFNWTFGDGGTSSGQNVTHVYGRTGTFSVALAIGDGKNTVNPPNATVTVAPSLAGTWGGGSMLLPDTRGSIIVLCPLAITTSQSGTSLTGTLTFLNPCFGSIPLGSGSSPGALTHPAPVAFATSPAFTFNGVTNLFIAISGTTNAAGAGLSVTVTLSRPSTGGVSTSNTNFTKTS